MATVWFSIGLLIVLLPYICLAIILMNEFFALVDRVERWARNKVRAHYGMPLLPPRSR